MKLKSLVLNAAALSSAKLLATASQFLILPVIARHLTPDDFGLVALAMTFVVFGMVFSDAGLGQSLVRTKRYNHLVWSSAFWFVVCIGLGLAVFLILIAPVMAWWFNEEELRPILITLSFIPLILGLLSVPQAEMQKRGAIAQIAIGETLGTFAGFAVAIWIATHGGGAWALVMQQIIFWVIRAISVGYATKFRPRLLFSWTALGEHMKFGLDTVGFALVNFILRQAQNLVIGKSLGSQPLGVYSMANRFANLPTDVIGGPIFYTLYSHLVTIHGNKAAMRHMILSVSRLLAILIIPPMALVAAGGEAFFTLFLSEKWSEVSTIFLIIAPMGAMHGIAILYGTVLMATGETNLRLRIAVEMALYWLVLLASAVSFGIQVIAIAHTVWFLSYFPRLTRLFLSSIDCKRSTYFSLFLTPSIIAIIFSFLHHRLTIASDFTLIMEMVILLIEMLLAWGLIVFLEKKNIQKDIQYLRNLLAHPDK